VWSTFFDFMWKRLPTRSLLCRRLLHTNKDYPNGAKMLVEPSWLEKNLEEPGIRLIDCSSLEVYRRAHIKSAIRLPVHAYLKDDAELYVMSMTALMNMMSALGISKNSKVIAYDDCNSLFATRLWWLLKYYGHSDVAVLHGGFQRWAFVDRRPIDFHASTSVGSATHTTQGYLYLNANAKRIALFPEVSTVAKTQPKDTVIFDARSEEEYTGTSPVNPRKGHIPGARHLEYTRTMTQDDKRMFLPPAELQKLLDSTLNIPSIDTKVITHCQKGIRGAHAAFVLELMGYKNVKNYDASLYEYAAKTADEAPLTKGHAP